MIEPMIYLWVHQEYADRVDYTQTTVLHAAFRAAGAQVVIGDAVRGVNPVAGDHVINYGNIDDFLGWFELFAPACRWHYVMDEQGAACPRPYDRAIRYMQRRHHAGAMSVYQNPEKLQVIRSAGKRVVAMPHCIIGPRSRAPKLNDVIVSGAMHPTYYPTRTRLASALRRLAPEHLGSLSYPSNSRAGGGTVVDDAYLGKLETYRMGVVCRAGWHDRFVGKYVEMGVCRVLPVGDCPSYMHAEMKAAMVDVERMTDEQAVAEVKRLLGAPEELEARTEAYHEATVRHYTARDNVERAIREMTSVDAA